MAKKFNYLQIQLVPHDETSIDTDTIGSSIFLEYAQSVNLAIVVGELEEGTRRDESLGQLWSDVKSDNNKYDFELATVLPYYLPSFKNKPEYTVEVMGDQLYVCNRMTQCFYSTESSNSLDYLLIHRNFLGQAQQQNELGKIHPAPLKTFISQKFEGSGSTAEHCVEENFLLWRDTLILNIAKLIDGIRIVGGSKSKHLLPKLSSSSFPLFWLAVKGKEKIRIQQFVGDLGQSAFKETFGLEEEQIGRLGSLLKNEAIITVSESALSLSETFLHYGYIDLAILQICIACESVLAKEYELYLLSRHATKSKIDDNRKAITFSQLLNLHVFSMRDIAELPNYSTVIGDLNRARDLRNTIVHEGVVPATTNKNEVMRILSSAKIFVEYMEKGIDSSSKDT
ncbi:MAG: hypothetical protein AB7T49_20800 [Oligoflexales bacterium]